MYCPYCGSPRQPDNRFCGNCGAALSPTPTILSEPAPRRKPSRVPAFLLAAMSLIGLLLFFLIPLDTQEGTASDPVKSQASTPHAGECFLMDNGVLRFDSSKYSGSPVLTVPSSIQGQPVTTIGAGCFENVTGITTIVLPDSVTSIGDRAFAGCADLRGLFVPEAVTAIGTEAFRGCENLESVYISTAVTSVGTNAFEDCPNLIWLFYSGFYAEWIELYPQPITPFTWAVCWDGEYLHGSQSGNVS